MPSFVPVHDEETPRSERDDSAMTKHRKFDSMVVGRAASEGGKLTANRGWSTGTVGWGVQGKFGSMKEDDGSAVRGLRLSGPGLLQSINPKHHSPSLGSQTSGRQAARGGEEQDGAQRERPVGQGQGRERRRGRCSSGGAPPWARAGRRHSGRPIVLRPRACAPGAPPFAPPWPARQRRRCLKRDLLIQR